LAKACEVEWELNKNTAPPPPQSPSVENGSSEACSVCCSQVEVGRDPSYGEMKFYFVDMIHVYEGRKGEIEIFYQVVYTFMTLLILNWLADVGGSFACDILSRLG